MSDLRETLEHAVHEGRLLATSVANILQLLSGGNNPLYAAAIEELAENEAWTELNDRFFKTLAFGTGGLRGRTIGKIVTRAEAGSGRGKRLSGIPLRRDQRDEFLQYQPGDSGAGSLHQRVPGEESPGGNPEPGNRV